jgi:Bacteriophage HK97-gp10, putative tail-component
VRMVLRPDGIVKIRALGRRYREATAEDVAKDARRRVPVDSGELRSTIMAVGSTVRVGTDYWASVEYGSRPHIIQSHGDYPLRNRETGQAFGRLVHHPGTPAQPFMRPALYQRRRLHL